MENIGLKWMGVLMWRWIEEFVRISWTRFGGVEWFES
jgi:hypothetical protein